MKPDIAEKWVEALRSGEYKQTQGQLKRGEDQFCCLGVLCDIYRRHTRDGRWDYLEPEDRCREAPADVFIYGPDARMEDEALPTPVRLWAGIHSSTGHFTNPVTGLGYCSGKSLVDINDTGYDFAKIADIIEAKAEEL